MADPASAETIRLIVVEDEGLFRDMLRIALAQNPRFEVVGAFADGETAIAEAPRLAPQVALLDIELGSGLNGVQAGLRLRQALPDLGIVLLSNHGDPQFVASLPQDVIAGWSYLLKPAVSDAAALGRAIEGAAAHLVVLDPHLVQGLRPRHGGLLGRLSPRQSEILALLAQGYTNAGIADRLCLAEKSVENQINLLYQNLGVSRDHGPVHPRVKAVLIYLQESRPRGPARPPA